MPNGPKASACSKKSHQPKIHTAPAATGCAKSRALPGPKERMASVVRNHHARSAALLHRTIPALDSPLGALLVFGLYSAGLCLVKGLNQTNMDNRFASASGFSSTSLSSRWARARSSPGSCFTF